MTATLFNRVKNLESLFALEADVPEAWLEAVDTSTGLNPVFCNNYNTLLNSWRKALKWTDGLDVALSVMLSSVTSTKSVGEQLWVKIIGPPSSGKTTLLEGLAVNRKYVLSKSTIRGFHSGYKTPDGEDHSLIVQVRDKTLATKDGDTLLKAPNLGQILAEARDIYDMTSRTHYRNASSNDYSGIRMTWLLCGTAALREIDESELGARFIDCVIMDGIDEEFEDDVNWRAANQEDQNMALESDGDSTTQYTPALVEAMQLTGGYVDYLRTNAQTMLGAVKNSEWALRRCTVLGKFIAFMRARPAKSARDDSGGREFSPRLVKLMVRLAKCMAVVLNKQEVDEEVMARVTKVAMDTSRGQSLKVVEELIRAEHGMERRALSILLNRTEAKLSELLRFLKEIGVVEMHEDSARKRRWVLTARMRDLYTHVEGD